MRNILINFLNDRIAPHAKRISDANDEISHIESSYNSTIDHAGAIDTLIPEIKGLRKSMSAVEGELLAFETAPPIVSTPKKASASPKIEDDSRPMTKVEELTRALSSLKFDLEIKERQLSLHQKQLSFPERKEELEAFIQIEHEALQSEISELNKLILSGEKPSVFRWTKKLDLFNQADGYGFMHYLAHYDVLQYVLPVMLENSTIIANRELSGRYDEQQSQKAILQMLGETDKAGIPPIQRALVNGSIGTFRYILELPVSCKKGIFEVGLDRSNIFHQAMLKGVFQDLVPI